MPSTKQLLTATRELVAAGWTKGAYNRRGTNGNICYCLVGAMSAAVRANPEFCMDNQDLWQALCTIQRQLPKEYHQYHPAHAATMFNDDSTQQDVINLLDRVIEVAK